MPTFACPLRLIEWSPPASPDVSFGTGFVVAAAGRRWLATCWHNIAPTDDRFDGQISTTAIMVDDAAIVLSDRAIVGCRLGGLQLDVAAIGLLDRELADLPVFDGLKAPAAYRITPGLSPYLREPIESGSVHLMVGQRFHVQGFPEETLAGTQMTPIDRSVRKVLSNAPAPGATAYIGHLGKGYSGAPVVTDDNVLAGIHYGSFDGGVEAIFQQHGSRAKGLHTFKMGLCVRAPLLLSAIDHARDTGIQIIDVIAPSANA